MHFRKAFAETIFMPLMDDALAHQNRLITVAMPTELGFVSQVNDTGNNLDLLFQELFDAEATLYPLLEALAASRDVDKAMNWMDVLIETATKDLARCNSLQDQRFGDIIKIEKEQLRKSFKVHGFNYLYELFSAGSWKAGQPNFHLLQI